MNGYALRQSKRLQTPVSDCQITVVTGNLVVGGNCRSPGLLAHRIHLDSFAQKPVGVWIQDLSKYSKPLRLRYKFHSQPIKNTDRWPVHQQRFNRTNNVIQLDKPEHALFRTLLSRYLLCQRRTAVFHRRIKGLSHSSQRTIIFVIWGAVKCYSQCYSQRPDKSISISVTEIRAGIFPINDKLGADAAWWTIGKDNESSTTENLGPFFTLILLRFH